MLVDTAMDLETNATKGLSRENSLVLRRGSAADDAVVKMAQTFRSGTNDIDAIDFVDMFLDDEDQIDPDELNELYVLVNFRPVITNKNWRMDCGVAGYDNTFGLPPFFPTRLRFEDYIYRLWIQQDGIAVGPRRRGPEPHARSNYMRNPPAAEIFNEEVSNLLKRKIGGSVSRLDELSIAFDYEGEVTAQDAHGDPRQDRLRCTAGPSRPPTGDAARAQAEALRLFAANLQKAFYGFEPDFFQQNLLRIVDDVVSVIKGSIELWPTLVEICYFQKDRRGLPRVKVANPGRPDPRCPRIPGARPMRIAQVAPLFESVPPQMYGGTERVVSYLTEELVPAGPRGDAVRQRRLADARPACRGMPPGALARARLPGDLPHHVRLMELVVRQDVSRFDIIHFHLRLPAFAGAAAVCPVRASRPLHGESTSARRGGRCSRSILDGPAGLDLRRAAAADPEGQLAGDGLPRAAAATCTLSAIGRADTWRSSAASRRRKGWSGPSRSRGSPACRCKVAAKIYPEERRLLRAGDRTVVPGVALSSSSSARSAAAAKDEFLGNASALVFPIDWPEPFGLVMIEAMACGTPVMACRRGSVPEVVTDGVTGFVVDDIPGAVEAVRAAARLDRRACRRAFAARFGAARMAADYLDVYRGLIEGGTRPSAEAPRRAIAAAIHHEHGLLGPVGLAPVPAPAAARG